MYLSPVEEIKNRLDIVEVVGWYVKLQKAGANLRALCPFHQEKSPSFFVSPSRQIWHCFGGCSEGGDIFKFIMKIEGLEFRDALRLLAQKTGVELRPPDSSYEQVKTERTRLYDLLELATRFFEKQLLSSNMGQEAMAYLARRGVLPESISKWRLGYAPDSRDGLLQFLQQKGYRLDEIGKAGLSIFSEGTHYDRFRGRVIFPVFDIHSQVIGFGGRIFGKKDDGTLAKYINTSNTPLYDKSHVLYGIDKARLSARKNDFFVLVEGYMDAIMVSQAGCDNVVAVSGTALTLSHLQVLKRYTENLFLAFDMDVAGDNATKRGIDLAISQGFAIKIITMPEAKDPADAVLERPEQWHELVAHAKSIFDFYFDTSLAKFDKTTLEGKKKIANTILPVIKKIPNKIEQSHWIHRLAEELQVREENVYEELRKTREQSFQDAPLTRQVDHAFPAPRTRREMLEERILLTALKSPQKLQSTGDQQLAYFSLRTQEVIAGLRKNTDQNTGDFAGLFSGEMLEFVQYLAFKAELQEDQETDQEEQEFSLCMNALRELVLKEKLDRIAQEINHAEKENNSSKVEVLMKEFSEITRNLSESTRSL